MLLIRVHFGDAMNDQSTTIDYADFLKICVCDDDDLGNFGGFKVTRSGLFVNDFGNEQLLGVADRAAVSWHPTGNHTDPALAFPCTVAELKSFVADAGLSGCINEAVLAEIAPAQSPTIPATAPDAVKTTSAAHAPTTTSNVPRFTMSKSGLIKAHKHEWSNIENDIVAAANNGLDAAKGPKGRGWFEDIAMEWARAKGRLKSADKTPPVLAAAMHTMASCPSRIHAEPW